MKNYFGNVSLVKKLIFLLVLTMLFFAGIMAKHAIVTQAMRRQHRYIAYQLSQQGVLLLDMQTELREVAVILTGTFNDPEWLASADSQRIAEVQGELDRLIGGLLESARGYFRQVHEDEFILGIMGEDAVNLALANMERVLWHINEIHSHYRLPRGFLNPAVDGPFDQISITHTIPAVSILDMVREFNLTAVRNASEVLYRQQTRVASATFAVLLAAVALVFSMFVATIADLKRQIKRIKQIATEEAQKSAAAEQHSQAKSRFLANMSHEIRTPINAVLGISEIQLQNSSLPVAVEESFAKIYNSGKVLLGIINDILDLSKIESGKMEIIAEEYQSASLINDIVQLNLFRIGNKKIKFEVGIGAGVPVAMRGDELRIKQVVSNLLSNAFKYTEKGAVSLDVKFSGSGAESGTLHFRVADTGGGMNEEHLADLFKEYARFNAPRHIEGIGLGMSIVDNLLRLMNAKIHVESKVGVGTTIEVEIPQERASGKNLDGNTIQSLTNFSMAGDFAAKKMMVTPEPMPYGHVLVVDDVDINLYVAQGLLSFYGLNVQTASSGKEALELVKAGNVYDIILMDHMMPGMDGMEATRQIRETGYANAVVALTANALIGQAEYYMQNGFDGFISKPIDSTHLYSILNKFIRDRRSSEVVAAARESQPRQEEASPAMLAFAENMRAEFARSQSNAAFEIRAALALKDAATARRLAHTLKSFARTIRETDLGDMASKLEIIFARGDSGEMANCGKQIEELETKLAQSVEKIFNEQGRPDGIAASNEAAADFVKVLTDLKPLLQESDAQALTLAKRLKFMPQAAILVRQIQDYDFDGALASLAVLKSIAS